MIHIPVFLLIPLLLGLLLLPGLLTFRFSSRLSLGLRLPLAMLASVLGIVLPWVPDYFLVSHAREVCTPEAPYTVHRRPANAQETPVAFPERQELDYGLVRHFTTYKSIRTGEVMATTQSWRIGYTPLVSVVLGLSLPQQRVLSDLLLPGCSFDSEHPRENGKLAWAEFWQEHFSPLDRAIAPAPVVPVTAFAMRFPDIALGGALPTLRQAVSRDPEVGRLYIQLAQEKGAASGTSLDARKAVARELLWRWAGVAGLDSTARGPNIDARDLQVIEQIQGQAFWGAGGPNPHEGAAPILKEAMEKVLTKIAQGPDSDALR